MCLQYLFYSLLSLQRVHEYIHTVGMCEGGPNPSPELKDSTAPGSPQYSNEFRTQPIEVETLTNDFRT